MTPLKYYCKPYNCYMTGETTCKLKKETAKKEQTRRLGVSSTQKARGVFMITDYKCMTCSGLFVVQDAHGELIRRSSQHGLYWGQID